MSTLNAKYLTATLLILTGSITVWAYGTAQACLGLAIIMVGVMVRDLAKEDTK